MKKKIDLYFVFKTIDKNNKQILTFVTSKEQVREFTYNRCAVDNKPHYEQWCILHKHDPKSFDTKKLYAATVADLTPYKYKKCTYSIDHIAMMYRIAFGCYPIGCSFDADYEYVNILQKANRPDLVKKATELINKEDKR